MKNPIWLVLLVVSLTQVSCSFLFDAVEQNVFDNLDEPRRGDYRTERRYKIAREDAFYRDLRSDD